eukprot:TRINITY_DN1523_c0_g1_i8.p1 TRINITY_DN1523_c0_g1~~TRINITY_DN1523_c0_g1_i8.p1  ORF type:complete len:677 (-),score=189.71 TRINITY_DN1523_c0_g1_i8:109-2076(-)
MGVLRLVICVMTCLVAGDAQNPGVPHYLSSTYFGNTNRIAVPKIPNSISEPALNAPAFSPFQASLSQPKSPVRHPFGASFPNIGGAATFGLHQPRQIVQFSPGQINSSSRGSFGASFTNLGQTASLGIQQQPTPVQSSNNQVSPPRLGKAIESGSGPKSQPASPSRASFNQLGSGPEGPQSSLQDSLGKALDQASRSSQFSLSPNKSPVLKEGGENNGSPGITRQGPVSGFPQRQQLTLEPNPSSPITSSFNQLRNTISPDPVPQLSSPVLDSFNQFRSGAGESQSSLEESLGQALDQASNSASFSLPQNASPDPAQGGTNFGSPLLTRQGPGVSQGSQSGFPQRSPSIGSGFSETPHLDLEQALTKASEKAAGQAGLQQGAQLSNIGPVIPAVPSGGASSKPLLEEINLGGSSPGSFGSLGTNIFRGNSASRTSPVIRTQSRGSPSPSQSGQPLVFDATPSGNGFDRQPFRSDPKISGQRIQQSGSPASSKIFLGSTSLSDSTRSSSLSSGSVEHKGTTSRKTCTKTFREECRNEYKMVCEETFTEREKYECKIVEETKCEQGHTTEYEPACFQQILENCENICKRGIQPDCMPQCARSLGKTSCHKVKVVTPHTTCIKVPKEVCGNIKKRVPYEKCHDVPKKICKQVPQEVCK